MSKKQPPRVMLNFEPDYEPPPLRQEKPVMDFNIMDLDVQEELIDDDDMMPKVQEKEKINVKDIFDNINEEALRDEETGEVNPNFIYSDKSEISYAKPHRQDRKLAKPKVISEKKPRKPMSEEHKQKLALAREKAMEVRKANAIEKKKMKELENEEKELLKKQKVKKVQKLKESVENSDEEEIKPTQTNRKIINNHPSITKKDLEEAQFDAIMRYETLRKQRKAEKKEKEMIESQKRELLRKLTPQTSYKYRDGSNPWDMCY
jgi:hypothetical protein